MNQIETKLTEIEKTKSEALAYAHKSYKLSYQDIVKTLNHKSYQDETFAGVRIILLLPDGTSAYLSYLSLFIKKATIIPVSILAGNERIKEIINFVKPHAVITNPALAAKYSLALDVLTKIISDETENEPTAIFENLLVNLANLKKTLSQTIKLVQSDIRMIVFTSGSTNVPKGVCLTKNNLISAAKMNVESLDLSETRKSLVLVPLYDYYGFIQIYSHILAGAAIITGESNVFINSLFEKINGGVTDLVTVPHGINEIIRNISDKNLAIFKKLKVITSSSDILSEDLLNKIFSCNSNLIIYDIYGLTEAGRASFRSITKDTVKSKNIGNPSNKVKIWIDQLADKQTGEIVIEGPNVMAGYLKEIKNEEILIKEHNIMRTGDLGYINEDGKIVLLGRKDHIINLRGVKIHPIEIENLALQVKNVRDAKASLKKDNTTQDQILLEIVVEDSASFELDLLKKHLKSNLNPLFFPAEIICTKEFSRTELGSKLIRR